MPIRENNKESKLRVEIFPSCENENTPEKNSEEFQKYSETPNTPVTAQSKPMSQTEKLGMKMKGLSIEIYDDEQFVPKFHNFDDDDYEDSEVESASSERTEEDFWETLANIKQKTCEQLSKGDEVD